MSSILDCYHLILRMCYVENFEKLILTELGPSLENCEATSSNFDHDIVIYVNSCVDYAFKFFENLTVFY